MSVAGEERVLGTWAVFRDGQTLQLSLQTVGLMVHGGGTQTAWLWEEIRQLAYPTSYSLVIELTAGEQIPLGFRHGAQQRAFKRAVEECHRGEGAEQPPDMINQPAPGWYVDMKNPGQRRYWDGRTWSDNPQQQSASGDGLASPSLSHLVVDPARWLWAGLALVVLVSFTAVMLAVTSGGQSQAYRDGYAFGHDEYAGGQTTRADAERYCQDISSQMFISGEPDSEDYYAGCVDGWQDGFNSLQ